jgi:hypothetical protein
VWQGRVDRCRTAGKWGHRVVKKTASLLGILAIALLGYFAAAGIAGGAGSTHDSPPPGHVGICHLTGDGEVASFVYLEPDVAAVFDGHLGADYARDIIPPFHYTNAHGSSIVFPGQNLGGDYGGLSGAALLANRCVAPHTTTSDGSTTHDTTTAPHQTTTHETTTTPTTTTHETTTTPTTTTHETTTHETTTHETTTQETTTTPTTTTHETTTQETTTTPTTTTQQTTTVPTTPTTTHETTTAATTTSANTTTSVSTVGSTTGSTTTAPFTPPAQPPTSTGVAGASHAKKPKAKPKHRAPFAPPKQQKSGQLAFTP